MYSMKKYSLIYMLSFLTDIFAFFALDYVTARAWADFLALLFFAACVYQLIYIIRLRKQDGVSCRRAIARFFLYTCCAAECITVIWYGHYFFGGYTPTSFFGQAVGPTVYGFRAIFADKWDDIFFLPLLIICVLYQIGYFVIGKRMAHRK